MVDHDAAPHQKDHPGGRWRPEIDTFRKEGRKGAGRRLIKTRRKMVAKGGLVIKKRCVTRCSGRKEAER